MEGQKPVVQGPVDGNAFAIIAAARKTLKDAGEKDQVIEMQHRAFAVGSYDELLRIVMEYVEFDL